MARVQALAAIAAAVVTLMGSVAHAGEACGAETHERFGETRAYFTDSLAACRPDGYCSAVVTLPAREANGVMGNQLRIARPTSGAPYVLELTAVSEEAAATTKHVLRVGRRNHVLPLAEAGAVNAWAVSDQAKTDAIVADLKAARFAFWRFQQPNGANAQTRFPLRGLTAALAWVDCMGANRN